jgi:hypothetical protein
MAYNVPPFLKRDGEALIFNTDGELIFYVPEYYFESKNASIVGEYVNILGVLDYAIFDSNGKSSRLKPFRFPTVFLCKPSDIMKMKDIKLTKYTESQDYRFLKFHKGDEVVTSVKVPQDVDNVELLMQLFTSGHIPTTISYDIMYEYFIESMRLNGGNFGMTSQQFGFLVSEICRDPKDLSKPFRLSKSKDMYGYKCINIRQVPKFVSPYTAITSENWDEAVVSAVLNDKTAEVPQEKIIMN